MSELQKQLSYKIGITLLPGIGDIVGKKLISYCGSVESVFTESRKNLMKIPGIGISTVNSILGSEVLKRAEEEIRFMERFRIKPIYYLDRDYPARLKQCIDGPIMLYYRGNADLNQEKIISIVGTRSPTNYGKGFCQELVKELSGFKLLIISGLAYGIDTQAHKAALKNNLETIAVLGHGLDRIYPGANASLAKKIVNQGGLLTDFKSFTNPDHINFPKRNRIVAGMSDAVIVIESAKSGGALITADIANSYNRDVFALPGSVKDVFSEGCNFLIKTNRAALLQSAQDIIYLMGWEKADQNPRRQRRLFVELTEDEKRIVDLLSTNEQLGIDKLCIESQLSATNVVSALLNLEFEGLVKCLPGKVYRMN